MDIINQRRKEILDECVKNGMRNIYDIAEHIKSFPEFSGLKFQSLATIAWRHFKSIGLATEKSSGSIRRKGGRTPLALIVKRNQIIDSVVSEGAAEYDVEAIANKIRDFPEFAGMQFNSLTQYVSRYLRGKTSSGYLNRGATKLTAVARYEKSTSFDDLINSPRVKTLLKSLRVREFDALVGILRGLWQEREEYLVELQKRIEELAAKVREYESHRCQDADENLRAENQELKEQIAFFEKRIEALSRLTAHKPLTESHLVVSGR
jgi:FtsZ-binding cell division protein ZapB